MFAQSVTFWAHVAQRLTNAIGKPMNYCKQSWQDEKSKYLQMNLIEKRHQYVVTGGYRTISDLKEYFLTTEPVKTTIRHINGELNQKIKVFYGDMTSLEIDAIVNAANGSLKRGGGVCGAVFAAAGSSAEYLQAECDTLAPCKEGEARITGGYKLPAKYIIHAVGPRYKAGQDNEGLLAGAYKSSLDLLKANGLTSIAFPTISTGIFKFPNALAATVALLTTRK